jgi:hypothetical protein
MNASRSKSCERISCQEWRFVWSVIAGVLVLTSLPYLYGYLSSPPDKQFMGLMLDVPDHGQYLSWWRGFQSSLLVSNKLTPEPNKPIFFNLQWWILAQSSRWTGLGYAPVYQAFRWIAGGSFLLVTYRLIAQFFPQVHRRWTAFLLVTLSSGLGWVLIVLKYTLTRGELLFPLDVYIAEGNSFLCILGYPHFAFAGMFIVLIFEFIWRGWKEARTERMVVAGLLALLLGWMHAYDLVLIYGIMGAFVFLTWLKQRVFPWRLFWGGVIVIVLSCSGAIYSAILTTRDPLWEEVLAQFSNANVYTPSPPHQVILFGFPLVVAVVTWIRLAWRKQWSDENLFVMGWFLASAGLNYIPTDYQIHMLNTWQIPMMLLATQGLGDFVTPAIAQWRTTIRKSTFGLGGRVERVVMAAFVLAVLPTNVYLWAWRFVDLARHDYPFYLHRDDVAALDWLQGNTSPDDVVLCSLTVGQYVPAISGNTAFLAHWAQTVGFYDKRDRVARFFDASTPDDERMETVDAFGVDYVLHGPAERRLGGYDPATTPWLTVVFSAPQVNVYCVGHDRLSLIIGSGGTR